MASSKIQSVAVYCGSSSGTNPEFELAARELGKRFADNNIQLIYGGAKVGLMGHIANEVLIHNGKAIGVLPTFLAAKEVAHDALTEMHMVDNMHERKAMMHELSDAFVALPGGYGTFEELFEMITWGQLGLHKKPIAILNVLGYYDALAAQMKNMVEYGFLKQDAHDMVLVATSVTDLMRQISGYHAMQGHKWISDLEQT